MKSNADFGKNGRRIFTSINDRDNSIDDQAKLAGVFDGPQRTSTSRDDVFEHDHSLARLNGAFNLATCAMRFGFFANDKALQRFVLLPTASDDRCSDGVGPDGHPADGIRQIVGERLENSSGNHIGRFTIKRQFSAVEIIRRRFPRGQCKIAKLKCVTVNQFNQSLSIVQSLLAYVEMSFAFCSKAVLKTTSRQYDVYPQNVNERPDSICWEASKIGASIGITE